MGETDKRMTFLVFADFNMCHYTKWTKPISPLKITKFPTISECFPGGEPLDYTKQKIGINSFLLGAQHKE